MRRWIEEGLAICLVALLVQVFAPVGASFAMANALDPLNAPICEHAGNAGGGPQHPAQPGDDGSCCTLCAFVHAGVAPPPALPVAVLVLRQPIRRPLPTSASAPPAQRWITRLAQPRAPPARS